MHFDFRLEVDGVFRSWAVPKGVSIDPADRRLAVVTEEHPFDYGSFEGVIPAGQYGAGRVIVWDCGIYSPDEGGPHEYADPTAAAARVRAGLEQGKLSIFLRGAKLKGSFALVRLRNPGEWFVLKHRDPYAGAADLDPRSPLSGHRVEEVDATVARIDSRLLGPDGPKEALPERLAPMLAEAATGGASALARFGPDWHCEPKLDGYRVLAFVDGDRVRLRSRNGIDYADRFPGVVAALLAQAVPALVVDGELVALDEGGRPSFHALQDYATLRLAGRDIPVVFFAFDLLHFAGHDLRGHRQVERTRWLAQCLLPHPYLQVVHATHDGPALYEAATAAGFEGVVAKRIDGRYHGGRRSSDWRKVKATQTAEFVVGGYTAGRGSRHRLGALLLGVREEGRLRYAGHVGAGLDAAAIDRLLDRLAPLAGARSPFTPKPPLHAPTTWVKPRIVVEVKYAELTPEGRLRAPVFLRVRDDRLPRSVRSPTGQAPPEAAATDTIAAMVAALDDLPATRATLEVGGERIALTHLDRVYWPARRRGGRGFTKRDLLRYLIQVSGWMLPHLADRPLTMIRMPDGIGGKRFFQKHWTQARPAFVRTIQVWSESRSGRQNYLVCNDLPTLVWLGQVGTLEFHVWHSRASPAPEQPPAGTDYASSLAAMEASLLDRPDFLVFDLDPYIYSGREKRGEEPELNDRAFARAREVAFRLRELLETMGLVPFLKTSGKTGLHIFAPVERTLDFDAARQACQSIGAHLMRQHPDDITMEWRIVKRTGRIFMDYNMNVRGKTLNAAYSPRGVPAATVSMPLDWEELARAHPEDFTLANAVARLSRTGDRWADLAASKVSFEWAVGRAPEER